MSTVSSPHRVAIAAALVAAATLTACGNRGAQPTTSTVNVALGARPSVLLLNGRRLGIPVAGTAFVYDLEDRLVATSAASVIAVDDLTVSTGGATTPIPARVAGIAPCEDVAALELRPADDASLAGLEDLGLGQSSGLREGQPVTAAGFGSNFESRASQSLASSRGTVSEPSVSDKEIALDLPAFPKLIQGTAPLEPSLAGGPLLDEGGDAVGMLVTSDLAERTPSYAIPTQRLRGVLDSLASGNDELFAGWDLRPLADVDLEQEFQLFLAKRLKDAGFTPADAVKYVRGLDLPQGAYVLATVPHSPADDADIFPGDMITQIDGEQVHSVADVCSALDSAGSGADVRVNGVAIASSTRIADIGKRFTVIVHMPSE